MPRAVIGAVTGFVVGVVAAAAFGAWSGYTHGADWFPGARGRSPTGAALIGAAFMAAYFWWLFGGVGAVVGGLAVLGSGLVRPNASRSTRSLARP